MRSEHGFPRLLGWSEPDRLDGCVAHGIFQAHVDKVQAEHAQESVEQGMSHCDGSPPLQMAGRARTLIRSLLQR